MKFILVNYHRGEIYYNIATKLPHLWCTANCECMILVKVTEYFGYLQGTMVCGLSAQLWFLISCLERLLTTQQC